VLLLEKVILNAMSITFCFVANRHHYTSLHQLSLEHTCAAVYPAQYKFCAATFGETSTKTAKYIITNSMRNHRRTCTCSLEHFVFCADTKFSRSLQASLGFNDLRCARIYRKNRTAWIVYNKHADWLYDWIWKWNSVPQTFLLVKLASTFMLPSQGPSEGQQLPQQSCSSRLLRRLRNGL
jgi:hypothetical protein